MELRSTLKPDDLFVSYWLGLHLMVVVGDRSKIYAVDRVPVEHLTDLAMAFEAQVTKVEQYACFIKEELRPFGWPAASEPPLRISEILGSLGSVIVTPSLRERVVSERYRRLVLFPDGILHALPIHLIIDAVTGSSRSQTFCDGIVYAPSASSYVYACSKYRKHKPRRAVVVIGDANDKSMMLEGENVARKMPCPTEFIFSIDELRKISPEADVLYIATHGRSPLSSDQAQGIGHADISSWTILLGDATLSSQDLFGEYLKSSRGAMVVLSACSLGRVMPGPVHEVQALIQAFFYAGAANVLAARWPILYESAEAVFAGTIERVFGKEVPISTAMKDAVIAAMDEQYLSRLIARPDAYTFFWGPFTLFGCGD